MKKTIYWIIASAVVLFLFPCLTVTYIQNDIGMAIYLVLLFAVNPVYSIIVGVVAGIEIKTRWILPISLPILHLIGIRYICGPGPKEISAYKYPACYFLVALIAMCATAFIRNSSEAKKREF